MRSRMLIIDAFADRPMAGNPAAVCPLEAWIADDRMQAIAAEMNLSETVYFVPEGSHYRIRWFTPTREVDLIGHATLAAGAFILQELEPGSSAVRFLSKGEHLDVRRGPDDSYVIDMPSLRPLPLKNPPAGLTECLAGARERYWPPSIISASLTSPMRLRGSRQTFRNWQPSSFRPSSSRLRDLESLISFHGFLHRQTVCRKIPCRA